MSNELIKCMLYYNFANNYIKNLAGLSFEYCEYFEKEIEYLKELQPNTYEDKVLKYRALNEAFYYKRYFKSLARHYEKLCSP